MGIDIDIYELRAKLLIDSLRIEQSLHDLQEQFTNIDLWL